MKKGFAIIPIAVMLLVPMLACDTVASPTSTPIPSPTNTPIPSPTNTPVPSPTNTPEPTPTYTPEPFIGGECHPGAEPIEMNLDISGQVFGGPFPNNCTEFCLWVPDDGTRLEITISDFNVDLDLYVDQDYEVLQSSSIGEAEWESIDFGTGDESVSIYNPGGRYYIQVCSYEGIASGFQLTADFQP
jgi:hypothetical protein